jgi:uncharacterized protein YndB with AHSA1/START domain
METNNFEIEINAPVEKVWLAITNADEYQKWMKSISVITNSEITFTCYDENGKVIQWEGMDMIWHGSIKTIEPYKELTCVYPDKGTGLIEESYFLEKLSDTKTKLIQTQSLVSKEVAEGYKGGTWHSLGLLKDYVES